MSDMALMSGDGTIQFLPPVIAKIEKPPVVISNVVRQHSMSTELPHEIMLYISTFNIRLLKQLLLHRPLYEYFRANRQHMLNMFTVVVTNEMSVKHLLNGKLHREDGPAVIYASGAQKWYQNDKLHLEDGPAIIHADGTQFWYLNDKRHREDGPAVIRASGTQKWYLNDKLHREDGPAVIFADGEQRWYLNGKSV